MIAWLILVAPPTAGLAADDGWGGAWDEIARGEIGPELRRLRGPGGPGADSDHVGRLLRVAGRLETPGVDPDLGDLARSLPAGVRIERSDHILLLHEQTPTRGAGRVALLERVVRSYYLVMAAAGFDLDVPRERLVSVWFARRSSYRECLRAGGAGAFLDTTGYFEPVRRAVLTYDVEGEPGPRWEGWDRAALGAGTAAHEVVHQLVAASGLARRDGDFPRWLHEGLAMQFEVAPGGVWAGFGAPHPIRLADWRAAGRAHRLAPLIRDAGLDRGYARARYAESWALVAFLMRTRPREFAGFLDALRVPDPDAPPGSGHEAAFRAAFGDDLDALEREWVRDTNANP